MWSIFGVVSAATLLLVQTVGVRGDGPPAYGSPYQSPNYAYQYAVKDDYAGVDFSADESRQADNTAGSYKVLLPDGRVQTVVYSVNGPDGGYIADIAYDGVAKIPEAAPYKAPASYAPAPAAAAPAPAYAPAPAPAPAPYAPAPAAPAYKQPSPYKAFPKFQQQATSYKSRIVFTQAQAAAETEAAEERSPKVLIDDSVVTNEIPDYELTKEARIEPEAIVVVEEEVVADADDANDFDSNDVDIRVIEEVEAVVPEVSRARSTTPPPLVRLVIQEEEATTLLPALPEEPATTVGPASAFQPSPFARSTTLPPVVLIDTTTAAAEFPETFSTVAPVLVEETAAPTTQAAIVAETTEAVAVAETTTAAAPAPAAKETVVPVEIVSTPVPEIITTEAPSVQEAIQAEAEAAAEEKENARRFARFRNYRPATRTRAKAPAPVNTYTYPTFTHFSSRSLNVQAPVAQPVKQVTYTQPAFNAPTIFYGNWVPVHY